jgi:hypothetical protein
MLCVIRAEMLSFVAGSIQGGVWLARCWRRGVGDTVECGVVESRVVSINGQFFIADVNCNALCSLKESFYVWKE